MGVESVSVEAEASAVTGRGAVPEDGDTLKAAAGGSSAGLFTVTWVVAVEACPAVSLTVTVTVKVAAAAVVWLAVAAASGPATAEPSLQDALPVAMGVESVSVEAEASAVTGRGAVPEDGDTLKAAAGGSSAGLFTVTWVVAVEACPAVSLTV